MCRDGFAGARRGVDKVVNHGVRSERQPVNLVPPANLGAPRALDRAARPVDLPRVARFPA